MEMGGAEEDKVSAVNAATSKSSKLSMVKTFRLDSFAGVCGVSARAEGAKEYTVRILTTLDNNHI